MLVCMFNQRYYRKTRFVLLADMLATVFVIGLTAIFGTSPGTATDSFEKPLLFTDAHVGVSPSLCNLTADRRLLFSGGSRVYRPLPARSPTTVITALLLILGGVEVNPGPGNITGTIVLHQCVSADVESAVCSTSSLTCYKYSAEFLLSLRYYILHHIVQSGRLFSDTICGYLVKFDTEASHFFNHPILYQVYFHPANE